MCLWVCGQGRAVWVKLVMFGQNRMWPKSTVERFHHSIIEFEDVRNMFSAVCLL